MSNKHVANNGILIGKKGLCIKVRNENINSAIAQLKKLMDDEGMNKELRKRKHYMSKGDKRRQKEAEGRARHLRDRRKRFFDEGY